MPVYLFPLMIILLVGGYLIYQANQRKWNDSILMSDETIAHEQEKISFRSYRAEAVGREMKNLFLRATNKRLFLLLPNKKHVYIVLDFTSAKENSAKDNIGKATMYVDKNSMKIISEGEQKWLVLDGENFMKMKLRFGVEVKDEIKMKKILGL